MADLKGSMFPADPRVQIASWADHAELLFTAGA